MTRVDRITTVVALGASAVGLAAYLTALGGVSVWLKLDASGLPANTVLSAYGPESLTAQGLRALMVWPVAVVVVLIIGRVAEANDGREDPTLVARVGSAATRVAIGAVILMTGALLALTTLSLGLDLEGLGWPRYVAVPAIALMWVIPAAVALALDTPPEKNERYTKTSWWDRAVEAQRCTRRFAQRRRGIALSAAIVYALVVAIALTDVAQSSEILAWGTFIVAWFPYSLAVAAVAASAGSAVDRWQSSQRADHQSLLVAALIAVAIMLPVWAAVYVGGILVLMLLAEPPGSAEASRPEWLPQSLLGRASLIAVILTAAAVPFQARPPQIYDRLTFAVGSREEPRWVHAALVGDLKGGDILVGVCVRDSDGQSSRVEVVPLPGNVRHQATITANGYAFYQSQERTMLTSLLPWLGGPELPALWDVVYDDPPPAVCGEPGNAEPTRAWELRQVADL